MLVSPRRPCQSVLDTPCEFGVKLPAIGLDVKWPYHSDVDSANAGRGSSDERDSRRESRATTEAKQSMKGVVSMNGREDRKSERASSGGRNDIGARGPVRAPEAA